MAFRQYTHCADFDAFKSHFATGGGQNAVGPLLLNGLAHAFAYGLLGALAGAGLGSLIPGLGTVLGAAVGGYIGFSYGFIDGFCDQWLNWRLICVQRDQCAMGRVAWIETVDAKFDHDPIEWLFDNDLSFNLRLTPYNGKKVVNGHFQAQFATDSTEVYGIDKISTDPFPSADVLRKPRKADGTEWDLSYEGYEGDDKPNHPGGRWTLHSEIEGNGMETLCTIAKVLAVLLPAAGPALGAVAGGILIGAWAARETYRAVHDGCKNHCSIPILCDVVCFIAAAVAAAVAAIVGFIVGTILGAIAGVIPGLGPLLIGGLIAAIVRHNGSFDDVANDPESGTIEREDCVMVFGDEVYDAGHKQGWVEIHPIKHLQKICSHEAFLADADFTDVTCCPGAPTDSDRFKSDLFKAEVAMFWSTWCAFTKQAHDPVVKGDQQKPENIWCLHPLIDGCEPAPAGGGIH